MLRKLLFCLVLSGTFGLCDPAPSCAADAVLSPQQMQMIEQLSPAEKEALAQKFAPSPSAPPAQKQEGVSPAGVTPRIPEESRIEEEFRQRGELKADRHRETDRRGAPQRTSASKVPPDEAEEPAEMMSAVELAEAEAEAEPQRLELRRAFTDFVAESKPLSVAHDLKQFGYELFAGTPSTFAPATDIPVPAEYVLGPGDELKVQLFGKVDKQLVMVVDREGAIAFPEIGPLNLAGMSFAEARAFIAGQIKEKTIGMSASITMGDLRSIRVFALGEVERPGSYLVSGLATLSQALFVSGGVKKIGSLRNVQLKRAGKQIATIDLYDFLLQGDTSADVRLLPGDVVFVPPIGATVGVAGEVKRPAIYELKDEQTLDDVLALAGGLLPTAYRKQALIERVGRHGERALLDVALRGDGLKTPLHSQDLIKIFSVLDYEQNPIFLVGNVKRPGKYAWHKGLRLSDLLPSAEALLPESFREYGLIEREAADNREPELLRFRLKNLVAAGSKGGAADLLLQPRDKVYVFHRDHFRQQPMVTVVGSVQTPGAYELKRSMRLVDLILASGGLLRDADRSQAELYRTDPQTQELHLINIDLARARTGDKQHNLLLQDLDRLVVHSIWETKEQFKVSVVGEVKSPGDYALASGMRAADLIFAAGNVTERAFLKLAEITRYQIADGERRTSEHLQIDLQAALRGDAEANLRLQPYDVLNVRTVSNWRTAERVTLSGEIKYPGEYPIENGEHLTSLLERAGGFLDKAYLPAAVFTRESIRADQQKQMADMARRIEEEIALLEASLSSIRDAELLRRKQKNLEAAKQVLEEMRKVKATGRLVIHLADIVTMKGTDLDITLRDGDHLHVPKRPDEVHVIGQVYNQTALFFRRGLDREDYLDQAGGPTRFADKKHIYVVRADGEVDPQRGWGKKYIRPGDVIVIPEKIERFNLLDSSLDWSRVLMQLGISVASMKTLDIL